LLHEVIEAFKYQTKTANIEEKQQGWTVS